MQDRHPSTARAGQYAPGAVARRTVRQGRPCAASPWWNGPSAGWRGADEWLATTNARPPRPSHDRRGHDPADGRPPGRRRHRAPGPIETEAARRLAEDLNRTE